RSFQVGPVASRVPGALVGALAAVVLAAMAGAVLVLRYRPRPHPRPRPPAGPRGWAEPHADPPTTGRLRVTPTHLTRTPRLEPHPAQASSHRERPQGGAPSDPRRPSIPSPCPPPRPSLSQRQRVIPCCPRRLPGTSPAWTGSRR